MHNIKFIIGPFSNVQVSGIKYTQKLCWACSAPPLPWVLNMKVRPPETNCFLKPWGRVPSWPVSQLLGRCFSVFIPCHPSTFLLCLSFSSSSYCFSFYSLAFPLRSWEHVPAASGPVIFLHPSIPVSSSVPGLGNPWTCRGVSCGREGQLLVVSLWATFVSGQLSSSCLCLSLSKQKMFLLSPCRLSILPNNLPSSCHLHRPRGVCF